MESMFSCIQRSARETVAAQKSRTMEVIERCAAELAAKGPCTRSTIALDPRNPWVNSWGRINPEDIEDYLAWEQENRHATLIPPKWKGERVWLVALIGEIAGDDEKYWALEREILGECL